MEKRKIFDYITVQEAAKLWGISQRRIQILCSESHMESVVHLSRVWLTPKNAKKPMDKRYKNHKPTTNKDEKDAAEQGENAHEKNSNR